MIASFVNFFLWFFLPLILGDLQDYKNFLKYTNVNSTFKFNLTLGKDTADVHRVVFNLIGKVLPGKFLKNVCSKNDAMAISSAYLSTDKGMSNCPKEAWLMDIASADPSKKKVLIDIGFNKGYNFAIWANVFAPSTNLTAKVWYQSLKSSIDDCGNCQECLDSFSRSDTSKYEESELVIVGLDLNPRSIVLLNDILRVGLPAKLFTLDGIDLYTVHAAGHSQEKLMKIPNNCGYGDESCQLTNNPTDPDVLGVSVDKLVADMLSQQIIYRSKVGSSKRYDRDRLRGHGHRQHALIDMLLIDAEGFDPNVLEGASQLIRERNVRIVVFEYHEKEVWKKVNLKDVVAAFAELDYDCFFEGNARLWPISGSCWMDSYEVKAWSNVMCVLRSDVWRTAVQKYVMNAEKVKLMPLK